MMFYWAAKCVIILLMIFSFIFFPPVISIAKTGNDPEKQAFLDFEKEIFDLIESNEELLSELAGEAGNKGSFYNIDLKAEQRFEKISSDLIELKVSSVLPDDIRASLEEVKRNYL
ncbi:hypothetical protein [Oceanobacillus timonensis]|uniref:hypothetical protein n=1 Tax=Oceanobacillus timonensis TaxID=1926285 RepID=UPI0009BC03BC|nr:hypothetical protein [Oceanobacillus timonensis]